LLQSKISREKFILLLFIHLFEVKNMINYEKNRDRINQKKMYPKPEPSEGKNLFSYRRRILLVGCLLLLLVSGSVRAWQDIRFATVEMKDQKCPFDLKDLPTTLGNAWQLQEGGEGELEDEVKRVAGCSDSLIRTYRNDTTGVSLTVLILYGPAKTVAGHAPEICYPAAGYRSFANASFHAISGGSKGPAGFRSELFAKNRETHEELEEVYYSFFQGNRWSPDSQRNWKDFRHHPSMFKIQVQRRVVNGEWRNLNNPTEQFLSLLLPELENRIFNSPR